MTRRELIEYVQRELTADATTATAELSGRTIGRVLDAAFAGITAGLAAEGRYSHPGFGTFTVKTQAARPGLHPKTGAPIQIAEALTIRFKPATDLKARLEDPPG